MLKMLNQITGSETDTFDEVNKVLNILREKHNELVDACNANAEKCKSLLKPKKKGDK